MRKELLILVAGLILLFIGCGEGDFNDSDNLKKTDVNTSNTNTISDNTENESNTIKEKVVNEDNTTKAEVNTSTAPIKAGPSQWNKISYGGSNNYTNYNTPVVNNNSGNDNGNSGGDNGNSGNDDVIVAVGVGPAFVDTSNGGDGDEDDSTENVFESKMTTKNKAYSGTRGR